MAELQGTHAPQIMLPEWGHLGNGSEFMRGLDKCLRSEIEYDNYTVERRNREARKEARHLAGARTKEGLGELIGVIPARDFFRARQQYGEECWDDNQFIKEWYRDNPSHRAQR